MQPTIKAFNINIILVIEPEIPSAAKNRNNNDNNDSIKAADNKEI